MLDWDSEELEDAETEAITSMDSEQRQKGCLLDEPDCEACQ